MKKVINSRINNVLKELVASKIEYIQARESVLGSRCIILD